MNVDWITSRVENSVFLKMHFNRWGLLCLFLLTLCVPTQILAADEESSTTQILVPDEESSSTQTLVPDEESSSTQTLVPDEESSSTQTLVPDEESKPAEDVSELALGVKSRPRWVVGVGVGHVRGYDYPASRDHNRRTIALPFFVFRTRSIRFGGGGIRAVAIEKPRIKLDLSISGSLNASSSDDGVREGMPGLDFLFEIGPQLEIRLRDDVVDGGSRLQSRFTSEIRAVFSTDFSEVDHQGLVAEAGWDINLRNVKGTGIDVGAAIDLTYANEKLQDYFYEVPAQFATATRAEYDAKGGYLESRLSIGMGFRPLKNVVVFLGVFAGLYDGAANETSPLFETTSQTGFALGVVWTIAKSRTMVEVVELSRGQ